MQPGIRRVSLPSHMAYIYHGKGKTENIARLCCLNLRGELNIKHLENARDGKGKATHCIVLLSIIDLLKSLFYTRIREDNLFSVAYDII